MYARVKEFKSKKYGLQLKRQILVHPHIDA